MRVRGDGDDDHDHTVANPAKGEKWVVVYFYPGDFTPGYMAQAKAFNTDMAKLQTAE